MPDTGTQQASGAQAIGIAAAASRRRAAGKSGRQNTIVSGPRGITTPAPTEKKTLLGL